MFGRRTFLRGYYASNTRTGQIVHDDNCRWELHLGRTGGDDKNGRHRQRANIEERRVDKGKKEVEDRALYGRHPRALG